MSTRVLNKEYEYVAPTTLVDALDLLSSGAAVKILAGGTDILVKLKSGVDIPFSIMMDTKNLTELDFIEKRDCCLEMGALVKLSALEKHEATKAYGALYDALPLMASVAVRNMGTLGGNIANASPAADTACPMMVHGGRVILASHDGEREIPLQNFFIAPGKSAMEANEIMISIKLDPPVANSASAFVKKTRVRPDIAKISATAYIEREGDTIKDCRIAMGSVAATPLYLEQIASSAKGKVADEALFSALADAVSDTIRPIDDNRSTAQYRKDIAKLIVKDALESAWARTGGKQL